MAYHTFAYIVRRFASNALCKQYMQEVVVEVAEVVNVVMVIFESFWSIFVHSSQSKIFQNGLYLERATIA